MIAVEQAPTDTYELKVEYLRRQGVKDVKFGEKSIYIFFKDGGAVKIELQGSNHNDHIKFWTENKRRDCRFWNIFEGQGYFA